jgi:predicted ATP-dependent serine protease
MTKTKAQRQVESAAAHTAYLERQRIEAARQRSLPTLADKVEAIGRAVAELAVLIGGEDAAGIATEMLAILDQETQA